MLDLIKATIYELFKTKGEKERVYYIKKIPISHSIQFILAEIDS